MKESQKYRQFASSHTALSQSEAVARWPHIADGIGDMPVDFVHVFGDGYYIIERAGEFFLTIENENYCASSWLLLLPDLYQYAKDEL